MGTERRRRIWHQRALRIGGAALVGLITVALSEAPVGPESTGGP